MTSELTPVDWVEPCAKFVLDFTSLTPRPIWLGWVLPWVAVAALAALMVWLRVSENSVDADL